MKNKILLIEDDQMIRELYVEELSSAGFEVISFSRAEEGAKLPLVRVYQWGVPSITYGYNQKVKELIDLDQYKGWWILKRPTGGGIVFHQKGEISFAVIIPRDKLNVSQAVAQTSKKIADFLKSLGLDVKVSESKRSQPANLCADFVSSYEITLNGKKLVGIAQRFGKKSILQQGTIFGKYPVTETATFSRRFQETLKNG